MKNHPPSPKRGVTSRDWSLRKDSRRNRRQHITTYSKCNNNKQNMIIFYKKWKKYNEIQLAKNKMDLIFEKWQIIYPPPRHMEDKVKNLGVILDSRLSFEHDIKSLCSRLNGTLFYLNRVKNTHDQKSRILLINSLIFSHLNYCSSICGKCSEKLQHEVQKSINFAAKVASNGKYLKRDHVMHPTITRLETH